MSKYTTEVRFICEQAAGFTESQGFDKVEEIITAAAPKVFNFPFPIFNEEYRLPLEKKILRHFYTREICEETVGLWKLRLSAKLNEIMPYYNQLYESELLEFNPFWDTDLTRDSHTDFEGNENTSETVDEDVSGTETREAENSSERNAESERDANGTSTNTRWDLYSDTPQGGINGIEGDGDGDGDTVDDNYYLTNARKITDNGATTDHSEDTAHDTITYTEDSETNTTRNTDRERTGERDIAHEEDFLSHIKGKQGGASYSYMLMEFRKAMLNIDQMILNELAPLFFGLW